MSIKKFISVLLILAMMCSLVTCVVSAETTEDINGRVREFNDFIIKTVEDNSTINSDGMIIKNEVNIISKIAKIDLNQIQRDCETSGVVFEKPLTKEGLIKSIKDCITNFNNRINNKELKVLKNGTVIETNDNNFYLQGGIDSRETYWWGSRDYMCTNCAWEYKKQLDYAAIVAGSGGGIAGLFSCGVGIVAGIVGVAYLQKQAADVSYYNSISSRGIILDQNYWLTYSISNQ